MRQTKCKIMFFLYIFGQGGAERVILNILNYIDNDKYDIRLILGQKTDDHQYLQFLKNEFVKVEYLDVAVGQDEQCIQKLSQMIVNYHPDILFTEARYTNDLAYHAKMLSKDRHVKLIFSEAAVRSAKKEARSIKKRLTTFFHYNFGANQVICVSKGVANDLMKKYGILPHKITIIHNPMDIQDIIKKSSNLSNNPTFNKIKGHKIVNVARLTDTKNHKLLIDAFRLIDRPNVNLVLIGTGESENTIKSYCNEQQVKNVFFLGFQKNPYYFMKKCDVFTLTSKAEGFGNVIVESMIIGTPVVSVDCPSGPREIIGNNKYGLLVPNNDPVALANAIKALLDNPNLAAKYSSLGRQRSKDFDAEKIVRQYENTIDKVYQN